MKNSIILVILLSLFSCNKHWHTADLYYTKYEISSSDPVDHPLNDLINPYKQQLDSSMNQVIGMSEFIFIKQKPESTLGNWVADILLEEANRLSPKGADIAFQNYGGLRVPSLPKGAISVRNIYELMPFDNMLIIQEIPGHVLWTLGEKIASEGGWPVSSGAHMEIKEGKLISFAINGIQVDKQEMYRVANNDYIASGGGNCEMLVGFQQEQFNAMIRDIIIEHIQRDTDKGIIQSSEIEGRIKKK